MKTNAWDIGDVFDKNYPDTIQQDIGVGNDNDVYFTPESSSVIWLEKLDWADKVPAVITGGILDGKTSAESFGLAFSKGFVNGMSMLEAHVVRKFPPMKFARYLHQSAAVKIKGQTHLIVMGGKTKPSDKQSLNSVHMLNIHYMICDPKEKKPESLDENWKECAPMSEGRSLFASTVINDNFVYVYGGINATVQGFHPALNNTLIEFFDAKNNTWKTLSIENTPKLSAFGWTEGYDRHELFILGGSDGLTL